MARVVEQLNGIDYRRGMMLVQRDQSNVVQSFFGGSEKQ